MFLGERRTLVEHLILAEGPAERDAALAALMPMQREDFVGLLAAMDGLPTTIRLLDPPLHEFLPDRTELAVRVAVAKATGEPDPTDVRLLAAVERLHEANPMLGLRGVRLGLVVPGLFAMQVRAIVRGRRAAQARRRRPAGGDHGAARGLGDGAAPRARRDRHRRRGGVARASTLHVPIGTMIELPRAALTARRIAESAEFFSFGTNDLTQTTWGFSRDDVEASIFPTYLDKGVFTVSPFESLDRDGVGALVRMAVESGRRTRPDIKLGVCGEHGGDPESVHFFHDVGVDYVSCSPFRVPVARLEAGRAALFAEARSIPD